ncbi:MAG: MBL fold metallo-hydrolase [bacterium]|nr:MBL fold metallo-hydrolase [bacterium]
MEIKYVGHSAFQIKSDGAKIVTDPYDSSIGMKFPKIDGDIVTISHGHKDHNRFDLVSPVAPGEIPLLIDMPGEFEKKGIRIFGFKSFHDKKQGEERGEVVLYKFESEGISVLHCGDLGYVPDNTFIDMIGDVDILMVPVGGKYTIDSTDAVELIKKIEPAIVIPMHFDNPKLNQEYCGGLAPLSDFLKKFGAENVQPLPKLIIKKDELDAEMKIVTLEISS